MIVKSSEVVSSSGMFGILGENFKQGRYTVVNLISLSFQFIYARQSLASAIPTKF